VNNSKAVLEVMDKSVATGTSRLVLMAIARHINRKTGTAYPGEDHLATLANCHQDTVRPCLRKLEELGELETEIQGGPGTSKLDKPNLYRIHLVRGDDPAPEQECISECVKEAKEQRATHSIDHTYSKSIYSGDESPSLDRGTVHSGNIVVLEKLKQSSVYELFGGAGYEAQFSNLDPTNPELELLRRELVRRTGLIPPPGFDPRMTREAASARLHEMFNRKDKHHADQRSAVREDHAG
jgi:hypothetical protein